MRLRFFFPLLISFFITGLAESAILCSDIFTQKTPSAPQFKTNDHSEAIWTIGQELDRRLSLLRAERRGPKTDEEFALTEKNILRALDSAKAAWLQIDNNSMVHQAVADYVAVVDQPLFKKSRSANESELQLHREKVFNLLEHLLYITGSTRQKIPKGFQFVFGLSSWEEVLQSWADFRPVVALSRTHLNDYDRTVGASLFELMRHDLINHLARNFSIGIEVSSPREMLYGSRARTAAQLTSYEKKKPRVGRTLKKALRLMKDPLFFPSELERHIARALVFQVYHESDSLIVLPEAWKSIHPQKRDGILFGARRLAGEGFYGELLQKTLPRAEEFKKVFNKLVRELSKP